ncbi:uncharacterized protein BYT42DRAFT_566308 [Radiomyces spectabilis]|uniref:uncharacterized protein n=1 Tax=Radiomyces spectabilis TaxID=64574 RepID=UPI00221F99B8|nr:uncharacterized protein BYT42DRAFT_566308 [Radiomyces spectabilis]KAI8381373.1 hypothetical protein BYT42DRAFT_566308 [Radiomyces spectabilis]
MHVYSLLTSFTPASFFQKVINAQAHKQSLSRRGKEIALLTYGNACSLIEYFPWTLSSFDLFSFDAESLASQQDTYCSLLDPLFSANDFQLDGLLGSQSTGAATFVDTKNTPTFFLESPVSEHSPEQESSSSQYSEESYSSFEPYNYLSDPSYMHTPLSPFFIDTLLFDPEPTLIAAANSPTANSPTLPIKKTPAPAPVQHRYKCPKCSHTSRRSSNMKMHILIHDTNRPKNFICPTCHKAFARKHDMHRHRQIHDRHAKSSLKKT